MHFDDWTQKPTFEAALADPALGVGCGGHARMFCNSRDLDLAHAKPGSFALVLTETKIVALRRDYTAMAGMIFDTILSFDDILEMVAALEARLNGSA